jgi:hypothetical protein
MDKDEFSDALAPYLDALDGQAPGDEPPKAPLNNFFGDDFLTLLYLGAEPCPRGLARPKAWLSTVANRQAPRHERAAAALALGRFLQRRQPELLERGPGHSAPIDWFRLSREFGSVVGALALANVLLARHYQRVEFDLNADPLPQLVSGLGVKASSGRSGPSIDHAVAQAWYLGARVALRHVPRHFSGWDREAFRCALACVVNYLVILPPRYAALSLLSQRRAALAWIKPLWNQLITAAPACEPDPRGYHAALIEQQLAVLLHLDSLQESSSGSRRPFGPALAPQPFAPLCPGADQVVVIPGTIPAASDKDDREILKLYEALRQPVALAPLPALARLAAIRETLAGESPWALEALSVVMSDLLGRRRHGVVRLGFAPVLLVGPPGTGKTRFAQRFSDLLGTPNTVINLAGMSDVKVLKGVTRGWASNRPSRMVEFIWQSKVANPLFVLDEIDKAGAHTVNGGDPQEALLDLLEPGNARRYQDVYLMTECDLSHCLYIATSNSLERLPEPLLSRLRPVFFPAPGPEHSAVIVRGVLGDMERAWGLPAGALTVSPRQMARLRGLPPRQMRRALLAGFGDEADAALYTLH